MPVPVNVFSPFHGHVTIPDDVHQLSGFLRWVRSGKLPERLPAHFVGVRAIIDFACEDMNSHNQVKAAVLTVLARFDALGHFFPNGLRLTNEIAGFSCEPDGMFVSHASLDAGGVTFRAGETTGASATEAVGTPDVVIEIVSPSSEDKDTEWLFPNYWNAGIPEYWLIDCRGSSIAFDVYRHGPMGYTAARRSGGWVRSAVFSRAFRLTRQQPRSGISLYTLETR